MRAQSPWTVLFFTWCPGSRSGQGQRRGGRRLAGGGVRIRGRALLGPSAAAGGGAQGSGPADAPEDGRRDGTGAGPGARGLVPAPLSGLRVLEPQERAALASGRLPALPAQVPASSPPRPVRPAASRVPSVPRASLRAAPSWCAPGEGELGMWVLCPRSRSLPTWQMMDCPPQSCGRSRAGDFICPWRCPPPAELPPTPGVGVHGWVPVAAGGVLGREWWLEGLALLLNLFLDSPPPGVPPLEGRRSRKPRMRRE